MMVSPQENRKFEKDNEWITIGFRLVEAKVKQEFPTPRPIGTALEGTSQGGKYDKPPDDWIRSELVEFGVLDTKVQPAALQGEIHPLFQRERWPYLDQKRFDALHQSFQLSTKLLAVAGPYFTSFIPETCYQAPPNEHRVALNPDAEESELDGIRSELRRIAPTVHFEEDPQMWPSRKGWLGITHTGTGRPRKPFEPEDEEQFRRADRRDRRAGHSHRQLTVGLASQFADVLVNSDDDSEEHLRAAFMAGITLTHEIGHVIHNRHFKHETWWGEPCVGQDIQRELGNALIAWLFDGWTPGPIDMGKEQRADMHAFKTGICWNKQLRRPILQPMYTTVYSMPMTHIQRIMSQKEWDRFDPAKDPWSVRRELLRVKTPFKRGEHARTAWKINARTWAVSGNYTDYEERDEDAVEAYEDRDWEDAAIESNSQARSENSGQSSPSGDGGGRTTNKTNGSGNVHSRQKLGSKSESMRKEKPGSKETVKPEAEGKRKPSVTGQRMGSSAKSKPRSRPRAKSEAVTAASKPPSLSKSLSSMSGKRKRNEVPAGEPQEDREQTRKRSSRRLAGLPP